MLNSIHLKYFYDTVRLKSVSKAAEHNCVSQSAVSQAIAGLEKSLRHPLLHHSKRSLQLTQKGRLLFEKTKSFIAIQEDISLSFSDPLVAQKSVSLACSHSVASSLLCQVMAPLLQVPCAFRLDVTPWNSIKDKIVGGEAHLAIMMDRPDLLGVEKEELMKGHFCLYHAKGHEPAKNSRVLVSGYPFEPPSIKKWVKNHENIVEIGSWSAIGKMVEMAVGIGLLPDFLSRSYAFSGQAVQDATIAPYTLIVVWPKKHTLSPEEKKVVETLKLLVPK